MDLNQPVAFTETETETETDAEAETEAAKERKVISRVSSKSRHRDELVRSLYDSVGGGKMTTTFEKRSISLELSRRMSAHYHQDEECTKAALALLE